MDTIVDLGIGALKFAAESFLQQLREQKQLIEKVPDEVAQLGDDIAFLHSIENYITKYNSSSSNIITRALLKEARGKIYEAEDAIDSFVIEEAATQSSRFSWLSGADPNSKLGQVAELVQAVCQKVNTIREKVENHLNEASDNSKNAAAHLQEPKEPPREEKYGPIFRAEENDLRSRLDQVGELEVIVITGMHGIGKTTLAAKIFYDKDIGKNFPNPIWVSVSNNPPENIFRSIMSQLPKEKEQEQEKVPSNHQELAQLVAKRLQKDQLLIVMDDVQEIDSWKRLERTFEGDNIRSKVLVTTNNKAVARYLCQHRNPIELEPLGPVDSWSLLEWRVKRNNGCPAGSEINGQLIADQCGGLPLVIDFVGDTFARTDSVRFDISERRKIWRELVTEINTYFTNEPQQTSILSSYNSLTYELRACFLYLGIFPRRSTFSVSKLTRMWIAEGFIRPRGGDQSLEKIAEANLKQLVDRNLVIVEDKMPDGSLKTCRMNYLFHDFCKTEAGHEKENFFQEFSRGKTDGAFNPQIDKVDKTRRFCIHAQISNFMPEFISSRPHELRVFLHSFVSHSDKEVFTLHGKDTSIIRAAFKLLRVLDAKPIEFKKIPTDLFYLRFVTISLNQAVLPEEISKLRNVQTLIVHTPSRTLDMKANILTMVELRHFKTNASTTLPKKSQASGNGERLQTLCGISPKSCTEKFFSRTPNVKKLGIRGKLDLLIDDKNGQSLKKLVELEKLKLLNDGTSSKFIGNLSSLIQPLRFPPSLRSLTLSATCLDWEHISILGSVKNLEELKLKDNAFVGTTWNMKVMSAKGFPSLETLRIENLDFVHWESIRDHFPELRRLELVECKNLEKVPLELADITTFQRLHLCNGKASAVASAREIEAQIIKLARNIELKLSIFPDDLSI